MSSSVSSPTLTRPKAAAVTIDATRLRVTLKDGRDLSVPLDWFDWLQRATDQDRQAFTIIGGGSGIWWVGLDEGISVPGLLGLPESSPTRDSQIYVAEYRLDGRDWIAEFHDPDISTFGRTLSAAKRHARELLAVYLEVPDLGAAGVEVVDEVHSPELEAART